MGLPFHLVIDYADKNHKETVRALEEFFGKNLPSPDWEDVWALFREWLIFDFKQKHRTSFLEEYTLKNPDNLTVEQINQFRQVAQTHFYTMLEIKTLRRGEWVICEDVLSGKDYKIFDKTATETIQESGLLQTRIAKVSNIWHFVGANPIFAPITFTPRRKKFLQKVHKNNKYSPKVNLELLVHKYTQPTTIPIPLTKKETEVKKQEIKSEFSQKALRYKVRLTFDDLVKDIYNESGGNVLNFWKKLEKKGLTEEFLFNEVELLQDTWNYFPHKVLGNKSPIEMFTELKKNNP